ncbi:MAG: ABC transporter permease [Flavobacteriales bacterium]|nr:ABC transporter permease [Flavobacteriales bacterium]MDW8431862.1 ABC transporter permease [Flavobacteriales bacterium]
MNLPTGLRGSWLYGISVLAGVAVVSQVLNVWVLSHRADPARQALGQRADEATVQQVRHQMGLHLSPALQVLRALNDLSPVSLHLAKENSAFAFDPGKYQGVPLALGGVVLALKWPYAGYSYSFAEPVHRVLGRALPATCLLAFSALMIGLAGGVFLGFISALKRGSPMDFSLVAMATLGVAVPSFLAALLASYFLAFQWHEITHLPLQGNFMTPDLSGRGKVWTAQNLILPALVLGLRPLSSVLTLVRTAVLEMRGAEFIKTARAKGLASGTIYWRHLLPNVLMPVVSLAGNWLASLMGGAVFVEYVFGWNGVGKLLVDALEARDFPLINGIILYMSVALVVIHYATEWLYHRLNPELRNSS